MTGRFDQPFRSFPLQQAARATMPPRRSQRLQKKQRGMQVVPAVVHGVLILLFGAVWGWHLTPEANEQKVAQQFPW